MCSAHKYDSHERHAVCSMLSGCTTMKMYFAQWSYYHERCAFLSDLTTMKMYFAHWSYYHERCALLSGPRREAVNV